MSTEKKETCRERARRQKFFLKTSRRQNLPTKTSDVFSADDFSADAQLVTETACGLQTFSTDETPYFFSVHII